MVTTRSISVPVDGGELYGEVTGPEPRNGGPVVILLPDLASNVASWRLVTARLPEPITAIAVDLRGRGKSAELPAPFGLAAHVRDCSATLSFLGAPAFLEAPSFLEAPAFGNWLGQRVVVVGHGFGAFVGRALAAAEHDRVGAWVAVDGGVGFGGDTIRRAELESEIEAVLHRIDRCHASREDALAEVRAASWRSGRSPELLEAVVGHELRGTAPVVRFATAADAIRADGHELLAHRGFRGVPDDTVRGVVLRAGLPSPWTDEFVPSSGAVNVVTVPAMDHDDLLHHPQGADAVARSIVRLLTSERAAPSRPS